MRETVPEKQLWWTLASACPPHWITVRSNLRNLKAKSIKCYSFPQPPLFMKRSILSRQRSRLFVRQACWTPEISVRPIHGQIDDLLAEVRRTTETGDKVLVTTLTKKMAERLTDYLREAGVRVRYLHSDIDTLERLEIIRDLRMDVFDVLVGINLLREGLDIPEVSLVAILDADKEGFLRSEIALVQIIGRAARNVEGHVIMYADVMTDSMRNAINETNRRRSIQQKYNEEHGITPQTIKKAVRDLIRISKKVEETETGDIQKDIESMNQKELEQLVRKIKKKMNTAAAELNFELAASLRDQMLEIRKHMNE